MSRDVVVGFGQVKVMLVLILWTDVVKVMSRDVVFFFINYLWTDDVQELKSYQFGIIGCGQSSTSSYTFDLDRILVTASKLAVALEKVTAAKQQEGRRLK